MMANTYLFPNSSGQVVARAVAFVEGKGWKYHTLIHRHDHRRGIALHYTVSMRMSPIRHSVRRRGL